MKNVTIVGQLVKDNIYNGKKYFSSIGGTVYYSSVIYKICNFNIKLNTSLNDTLINKIKNLIANKHHNKKIIFNNLTEFTVKYSQRDYENRKLFVKFNGNPIKNNIIENSIIHFGPLLKNDISQKTYNSIRNFKCLKVIDIQGLLRNYSKKTNEVLFYKNKRLLKLISNFNILKTNVSEINSSAKIFSISKDEIIKKFFEMGIKELLITNGEKGSYIYLNVTKKIRIPAFKEIHIKDTTGCGDVYTAVYAIFRYFGFTVKKSGLAASKVAGLKTSMNGINYKKTKILIKNLLNEKN